MEKYIFIFTYFPVILILHRVLNNLPTIPTSFIWNLTKAIAAAFWNLTFNPRQIYTHTHILLTSKP